MIILKNEVSRTEPSLKSDNQKEKKERKESKQNMFGMSKECFTFLRRRLLNNNMHGRNSARDVTQWALALPQCSVVLQYFPCTY